MLCPRGGGGDYKVNIQTSSLGPPSPGQGMKLCQGLCPMVGQDFGIQWLPLPLCGDFSAKLCAGAPAAAYPPPPPPTSTACPPNTFLGCGGPSSPSLSVVIALASEHGALRTAAAVPRAQHSKTSPRTLSPRPRRDRDRDGSESVGPMAPEALLPSPGRQDLYR